MGTRQNRLIEAVLTCTHNICFEQKYENSKKNSTKNCHFYSHEKSLYIAWACFRNIWSSLTLGVLNKLFMGVETGGTLV